MENIEARVIELGSKIDNLTDKMINSNDKITESLGLIAANLKEVNQKLDTLRGDSSANFENVGSQLTSLFEELKKINIATNYVDLNKNAPGFQA